MKPKLILLWLQIHTVLGAEVALCSAPGGSVDREVLVIDPGTMRRRVRGKG